MKALHAWHYREYKRTFVEQEQFKVKVTVWDSYTTRIVTTCTTCSETQTNVITDDINSSSHGNLRNKERPIGSAPEN